MKNVKWYTWLAGSLLTALVVLGLMSAIRKEAHRTVGHPNILVHVNGAEALLNEHELKERLIEGKIYQPDAHFEQLNLLMVERRVQQMQEVKKVRVYKNLGGMWFIEVWLRKPIARLFAENGSSVYLDSDGQTIAVNNLHTAHVLVISGAFNEPLSRIKVSDFINNDSLKNIRKLDDCHRISNYVCNDPLFNPLIGQVYLEKDGSFVLIPLVGDQKIVFGTAYSDSQVEDKFKRLRIFYEEGIPYKGWKKYSEINVKYDGQIVCKRRDNSPE